MAAMTGTTLAAVFPLTSPFLAKLTLAIVRFYIFPMSARIGVRLNPEPIPKPKNGLRMAAITSSVSFRKSFDPGVLSHALQSGELPKGFEPHIAQLLDETPLPLIVQVVEDTAHGSKAAAKQIWQHLERWARELQCTRKVWV